MLPGIKDGERLQVVKLDAKSGKTIARGDIVVFRAPLDESKSYIKRVIAVPGDRIEIRSGEMWLNDSKVLEPYLNPRLNLSHRSLEKLTVPPRNYFIMGDNRDSSADSRIWGCVPEELIYAKVVGK